VFNYNHYVPVLKSKEAELFALGEVTLARKTNMTPLLEIQVMDDAGLKRTLKKVEKNWNANLPIFIDVDDTFLLNEPQRATDALIQLVNYLTQKGFHPIPVTGLGRNPTYQQAVINLVKTIKEVCVRLVNSDLGNSISLNSGLQTLISSMGLKYGQADLIIDFSAFLPSQIGTIASATINTINSIPLINNWRTLTIAGTAFPSSLSRFTPVTPGLTPRSEWLLWSTVVQLPKLRRVPSFGDYTMVHPDMPLLDFSRIPIAAKIKYTTTSDWLILRWHQTRQHNWDKFYDLCDLLVVDPNYSGPNYCWGDEQISFCAARTTTSGNPAKWVKIGINHHLSFVADQVSSYALPSNSGTQVP
jgi:Beta protein